MWSLDCHGEAVVHRFVIGIGILTIKTPNKRVQSQCLESLVRLLRELFGLVLHTPLSPHEIEVVAHGIAEMSLNEHGPVAPSNDARFSDAFVHGAEAALRELVQRFNESCFSNVASHGQLVDLRSFPDVQRN